MRRFLALLAVLAGSLLLVVSAQAATNTDSSGWNLVDVSSCVQESKDIKITLNGGAPYVLTSTCRDAGHGLRDYTLTCTSKTQYKVEWKPCGASASAAARQAVVAKKAEEQTDKTTPKVQMTAQVASDGSYKVVVHAYDNASVNGGFNGSIEKMEVYIEDGQTPAHIWTDSDNKNPINQSESFTGKLPVKKTYKFGAKAYDAAGNVGMTEVADVTITGNTAVASSTTSTQQQPLSAANFTPRPVITSPANNAVLTDYPRMVELGWTRVRKAVSYEIELACDVCGMGAKYSSVSRYTTIDSQYKAGPLPGDNTYRVRVRAKFSRTSKGAWSNYVYFSFKTVAPKPSVSSEYCGNSSGVDGEYSGCVGDSITHESTGLKVKIEAIKNDYIVLSFTGAKEGWPVGKSGLVTTYKDKGIIVPSASGPQVGVLYEYPSEKFGAFLQLKTLVLQ